MINFVVNVALILPMRKRKKQRVKVTGRPLQGPADTGAVKPGKPRRAFDSYPENP